MVSIGNTIEPMQIYENMCRIHRRCLNKLESALDGYDLSVAEPSPGHGLSSVGSDYWGTSHTISSMLWGEIIMNSDGSTNDRMPSRQWQIRVGEKFDRIFEVTLAAANL